MSEVPLQPQVVCLRVPCLQPDTFAFNSQGRRRGVEEIDIVLPNNQRQLRTLHIQTDMLPCALCEGVKTL